MATFAAHAPASATAIHPLEPLTADEIAEAARILKAERGLGSEARFVFVALHEPPKDVVRAWEPGGAGDRAAHIVLRDRAARQTVEAVVSITGGTVLEWEVQGGLQAPMMAEEFESVEAVVLADARWQEAMRKRGVEDFSLCMLDPWASGYQGADDDPGGRRLARPLTFVRAAPGDNGYARPVEGLVVEFDLDAMAVVDVVDHGVVPLPPTSGNYDPDVIGTVGAEVAPFAGPRAGLAPIEITQPEGTSFTVDGHHVRWQGWDLRLGFNAREGLVLHQVGYEDGGAVRPIAYRASLSEMFVPYGDPAPIHRIKNVFDMGEYGIGWLANPLELGCDCLGEIRYFDGVVNDQEGAAVTIPNAICMHEEDYGIGWKHTDFRTGAVEVRRLRRLVISMIATVGNYEYGWFWHLYTDGTIEHEVKLTGIIATGAVREGETPAHGTLVAPGLYGMHHQHWFCVRLDMEVDGPGNSVVEVDSESLPPGPENPAGNAWVTRRRVLATAQASDLDPMRARFWKVENPSSRGPTGAPVAYKLMPGESVGRPFGQLDGRHRPRAGFAEHAVWVTAFDEAERYAAGAYPSQHPGGQGLPEWAGAGRPTEGADVVLWHSFCAHHIVRPEDWPVMPVTHIGFKLKPVGFFARNPALDMPRSQPGHGACHE